MRALVTQGKTSILSARVLACSHLESHIKMFGAITQLSSFSKLTPLTRSTLFRIHRCFVTRSNLFKAFNRPAGSHMLGKRCSHPVPPQYYEGKKVEERLTTFPNPALYSHQLCFKPMTDPSHPTKCCSPSNYCPVPHRRYYQVPYAGPPTYDTIAKRFSQQPSPVLYYEMKRANDAIRRGEYVDVHDVGGLNPKDYDVLFTDVNYNILRGEISVLGGIPYLQKATKTEAETVVEEGKAMVFGPQLRVIFPAVVSTEDSAYWIYFIVDTGSPLTYLSTQVNTLPLVIVCDC